MKLLTSIVVLYTLAGFSADTLCTHPFYPPITYQANEYNFYKYTPKYIPENLLHSFKILATSGDEVLCRFMERSEEEVIEKGMFEKAYRIRKEFCLEGYSQFTEVFMNMGIYYPFAMKTYILLCFHQYLNKEKIRWRQNKSLSLENRKKENKAWKERYKSLFVDPEPKFDNPGQKVIGVYEEDAWKDPGKWY